MTEEIDSIAPVGASASLDLSGPRVDVTRAPRPAQPPQTPPRAARPTPREAAPPAGTALPQPTDSLEESVKRINARLAPVNRVLQLRVDAETGITVAEIKNSATGQVLQEFPSTDAVHLAAMLSGWAHGKNVLVDLIA